MAHELGVRLIIPFINSVFIDGWGSLRSFGSWVGEGDSGADFFYSSNQRRLLKEVLWKVVSRRNNVTGRLYLEEPAILAWELGNELHDPRYGVQRLPNSPAPPREWTADIASTLRAWDPNHLLVDGGDFYPAVLDVAEIDMVGSTYYGKPASEVTADVDALVSWNRRSPANLQKVFFIKEFGLVEPAAGIPVQDAGWVSDVLDVIRGTDAPSVAGALYWSVRFHNEEGGFLHHSEYGGNIKALHWPGFSSASGSPIYELGVFNLLTAAQANLTGSNSVAATEVKNATPCPPSLLGFVPWEAANSTATGLALVASHVRASNWNIQEPATSTACMSFRGSTGAASYELWAALGNNPGAAAWNLVTENISDEMIERTALVGVISRSLSVVFPEVAEAGPGNFSFCLRACFDRSPGESSECLLATDSGTSCRTTVPSTCSACSSPLTLWLDPSAPALGPCPGRSGTFVDYDELWWVYYQNLFRYRGLPQELVPALWTLGLLGGLTVLWAAGGANLKRGLPERAEVDDSLEDLGLDSSYRSSRERALSLDLLRLGAVLHLVLQLAVKYNWLLPMSTAQATTTAAPSVLELPGFLKNLASWGESEFPYLFLHSGFLAALCHGCTAQDDAVWPVFWRRVSGMYPVFLIFAFASLAEQYFGRGMAIPGRYIFMFPFGVHAWRTDIRFQESVTGSLSWVVGPLVLLSALSLPICARLRKCSSPSLVLVLVACWLITIWQAAYSIGLRVLVWDDLITWIALRAFAAPFVGGVALGFAFVNVGSGQPEQKRLPVECLERFGFSTATATLVILWLCANPGTVALGDSLVEEWMRHGLFLPLQCVQLWSVASGRDIFLGAGLHWMESLLGCRASTESAQMDSWCPKVLGGLWFYVLNAAPLAGTLASRGSTPVSAMDTTSTVTRSLCVFIAYLLTISLAGAALANTCTPKLYQLAVDRPPKWLGLNLQKSKSKLTITDSLIIYYGGMLVVLLSFLSYALDKNIWWVQVSEVPDGPVEEGGRILSLLLYVPAMALGMGLLGQVIYAPVLSAPAKPLTTLVHHARASGIRFRLVFRIVTRGTSPDLVAANAIDAHRVLSNALPDDHWILEVVTDKAMGLGTLAGPSGAQKIRISEIVVPDAYRPAGGCLFKARALQYAVAASAAVRDDWIVHLDEETRFDGDTVAHIMEHCIVQALAVVTNENQKYGHIGQGCILYNVDEQESLLCTLADTIRVADDFGKFALQYRLFEQPLIGMHGSFVVCHNSVEMDVGFDHGIPGSITEDTYFAMKAAAEGVHVKWCGGHMYEQSPFAVRDFAKQRCRWFAGLWLCVRAKELPLLHRFVLGSHVISWAFCPFLNVLAWTNWLFPLDHSDAVRVSLAMLYAVPLWGYILGFFWTFSPAKLQHGMTEYCMLLFLLCLGVPVFALMEAYGVAMALYKRPFKKFELVQKQKVVSTVAPEAVLLGAQTDQPPQSPDQQPEEKEHKLVKASGSVPTHTDTMQCVDALVQSPLTEVLPCAQAKDASEQTWTMALQSTAPILPLPCALKPFDSTSQKTGAGVVAVALPSRAFEAARSLAQDTGGELDMAYMIIAAFAATISIRTREESLVLGLSLPAYTIKDEKASHTLLPVTVTIDPDDDLVQVARSLWRNRRAIEQLSTSEGLGLPEILAHGGVEWSMRASARYPFQFSAEIGENGHGGGEMVAEVLTLRLGNNSGCLCFLESMLSEEVVLRWVDHLTWLLCTSRPMRNDYLGQLHEIPLKHLDLAPALEIQESVSAYAGRQVPFDEKPVHKLLMDIGAKTPSAIAVHDGIHRWTYKHLCDAANQIALDIQRLLSEHDAISMRLDAEESPGSWLIALCFERSFTSLAAIYGVLTAGAAYLPLDPEYPSARITSVLEDAGMQCPMILIEQEVLACKIPVSFSGLVACASSSGLALLGCQPGSFRTQQGGLKASSADADALVYCLYTSGSTGKPKGVLVQHRALSIRISWLRKAFNINALSCVALKTSFTFGVSEWEIFGPLTCGGCVSVASPQHLRSVQELSKLLHEAQCTHLFLVPSHLQALLAFWQQAAASSDDAKGLKNEAADASKLALEHVVCCGEALVADLVADFCRICPESAALHNLYGPTEGSMTWWPCTGTTPRSNLLSLLQNFKGQQVPIGCPIDNTSVFLLDKWQRPVPVGVPGILHFGHCIAQGYLHQPSLTNLVFINNPIDLELQKQCSESLPSPQLYYTGDLAVQLEMGELRFLGRADRQVKVRGFRIELGAVEAAMKSALGHSRPDLIGAAVAVVALPASQERPGGELVGIVEAESGGSGDSLRHALRELLPAYMIPSRVLWTKEVPRLPNGKTDLKGLQRFASDSSETPSSSAAPVGRPGAGPVSLARRRAKRAEKKVAPEEDDEEVEDLKNGSASQVAVDSLGVARQHGAAAQDKAIEDRLSDNIRAFLMYGVIIDHWAGCSDSGTCQLITEGVIWQQDGVIQPSLAWLEVLVRSIGNYKCMSGFMMISAYNDSGFKDATRWSRGDLVVLITYLQMLWVLDPIIWTICQSTHPELCNEEENHFAGVHRWYLLVMLVIKACHILFRLCRVPPFLQCILLTLLAFTMPAEMGCLTEDKCNISADPVAWKQHYQSVAFLWTFLLQGASKDTQNMFTSAFMRYYVIFMVQYFWTFHYGRKFVGAFKSHVKLLASQADVDSNAGLTQTRIQDSGSSLIWRRIRIAALLLFIFNELLYSGVFGPVTYNYMQEQFAGSHEPRLAELLGICTFLTLQVCLFATALSGMVTRAKHLGSTTLGCYASHMYFTVLLMVLRKHFLELGRSLGMSGVALQLFLVLLLPLLFQATLGVAFHKGLMLQHRLLIRFGKLILLRVSR
eukprot:TRINITY_DN13823_c0_g1_i1.p1 TRINITY_DN13823_c0_g1~~TRINITY_DN13823_c0_g1_i1.p1  ORF type:complete len:3011 (-),score=468.44 TRINITY_DN13823_c0_g1_i1:78-8618(-)